MNHWRILSAAAALLLSSAALADDDATGESAIRAIVAGQHQRGARRCIEAMCGQPRCHCGRLAFAPGLQAGAVDKVQQAGIARCAGESVGQAHAALFTLRARTSSATCASSQSASPARLAKARSGRGCPCACGHDLSSRLIQQLRNPARAEPSTSIPNAEQCLA